MTTKVQFNEHILYVILSTLYELKYSVGSITYLGDDVFEINISNGGFLLSGVEYKNKYTVKNETTELLEATIISMS